VEFIRQLLNGVLDTWRHLTLSARINIGLWGVAVVVVMAVLIVVGNRPQFVTLTDQVTPANVTRLRTLMDEEGIVYRLRDSNRRVEVPMERLSSAQLLLAQNEIPVGRSIAPGFALFDKTDLMTSRYLQDVQFMRALQGELEQILNDFEFIEHSRVIIREAPDELFRRDERPAEALVTLETRRSLTNEEVKGIRSLIAQGGGPNLQADHITIMTTRGEVLAAPPDSKFASIANSKREYVVQLEREREQRLFQSLRDMGVRATVRVSAQVDFDEKETTQELAEEGVEISAYTNESIITSQEGLPEGAPGTTANLAAGTESPGGMLHSEETSETITNMEPSYTRTTTRSAGGDVIKYQVALVVEGDYEETPGAEGEEPSRNYVGLSDARRETYTDLARMAVGEGTTPTEVVLHDHPFQVDTMPGTAIGSAQAEASRTAQLWWERGWLIAQVVLILLGFLLIRMFLRRAIEVPDMEEEEIIPTVQEPRMTKEELRRQQVNEEIERLSLEDPELVTALLRSWLAEEED
jgi:flagellar M-ring protein FliF